MINWYERIAAVVGAAALAVAGFAIPALAGGSDSPTPYTVSAAGITLPSGETFSDNGHINIKTTEGDFGIHFESKCIEKDDAECAGLKHEIAQYIGKSYIPWSVFGLSSTACVSWVQLSQYNEHYGEGGQSPVCLTVQGGSTPEESESPTDDETTTPPAEETTPAETTTPPAEETTPASEPDPTTTSAEPDPTTTSAEPDPTTTTTSTTEGEVLSEDETATPSPSASASATPVADVVEESGTAAVAVVANPSYTG
ncbi:hypothetical protein [Demequina sp. NBRC 110054]|uniref:hypothetical protein n=1 Tax=Demequina sp. NBRC 110054 TaxID=1570343 RepID=UPI000A04EF77|nr:hypothetical protein [Demequina sp. NBRC 110054]